MFQFLNGLSNFLFVAGVVSQGDAEETTHVFKLGDSEVAVFISATSRPTERRLESEGVDELELFPHDNTSGRFFLLLNYKATILEVEEVCIFVKQQWEYPLFQSVGSLVRTAIHK